jgi:hypothetical protein
LCEAMEFGYEGDMNEYRIYFSLKPHACLVLIRRHMKSKLDVSPS